MKEIPKDKSGHWLDRWHVDPSVNREYDFIDGLRGIAILMVLGCHSVYSRQHEAFAWQYALSFAGTLGNGVGLFFTLSGFLISWPFWKRKIAHSDTVMPRGYGWRRFWKIYPPLALSVVLLTPFYICWQGNAPTFLRAAASWLCGLAFLVPTSGKFNPVMWSLVVEIHFYVVLPLLFLLTKRLPAKICFWCISMFLFAVPMLVHALTGLSPTYYPKISDPYLTGLGSFCIGVAVAGVDNFKWWNKRWIWIADAGWFILLLGLAGQAWARLDESRYVWSETFGWIFMIGSGCLLCYAAGPENPRARWLCAPWLRWCGIISYEWYLFHQPMMLRSRELFGPAGGNILTFCLIVAVPFATSIIFSALVYRFFSLPILQFGRAGKLAAKKPVNASR